MLCAICSTELPVGTQLCSECGATIERVEQQVKAQQESEPEIRPGTALCASIEGYIRLCEILPLTEAGAIVGEYLHRLLPPIQADGGQINWYNGEKIVAYFGFSQLTDYYTPAARAVHAGLELHKIFAEFGLELIHSYAADLELELRIGLATGEMLRGSMGDASLQRPAWSRQNSISEPPRERHRRMVIGDVVNLATQLEYEARPGHIVADGATVAGAQQQFEFTSLGMHSLRRRTAPVEIFSVVGLRTDLVQPAI